MLKHLLYYPVVTLVNDHKPHMQTGRIVQELYSHEGPCADASLKVLLSTEDAMPCISSK
jgi:hypothetical protein